MPGGRGYSRRRAGGVAARGRRARSPEWAVPEQGAGPGPGVRDASRELPTPRLWPRWRVGGAGSGPGWQRSRGSPGWALRTPDHQLRALVPTEAVQALPAHVPATGGGCWARSGPRLAETPGPGLVPSGRLERARGLRASGTLGKGAPRSCPRPGPASPRPAPPRPSPPRPCAPPLPAPAPPPSGSFCLRRSLRAYTGWPRTRSLGEDAACVSATWTFPRGSRGSPAAGGSRIRLTRPSPREERGGGPGGT